MSVELQYIDEDNYFRPIFIVTSAILALCYYANQSLYLSESVLGLMINAYLMIILLVFSIEGEKSIIKMVTLGSSLYFYVSFRMMVDSVVF